MWLLVQFQKNRPIVYVMIFVIYFSLLMKLEALLEPSSSHIGFESIIFE